MPVPRVESLLLHPLSAIRYGGGPTRLHMSHPTQFFMLRYLPRNNRFFDSLGGFLQERMMNDRMGGGQVFNQIMPAFIIQWVCDGANILTGQHLRWGRWKKERQGRETNEEKGHKYVSFLFQLPPAGEQTPLDRAQAVVATPRCCSWTSRSSASSSLPSFSFRAGMCDSKALTRRPKGEDGRLGASSKAERKEKKKRDDEGAGGSWIMHEFSRKRRTHS